MKKEKAIKILQNIYFEAPEIKEALRIAIDGLSKPSLPSNLDDAANNYCVDIRLGYPRVMDETDRYIYNAFKAGAEWMTKQGETREGEVVKDINNQLAVSAKGLSGTETKFGDKVIVQIRKK